MLERFDGVSDKVDVRLSQGASATSGASLEALTGILTVCALSCKSALEDRFSEHVKTKGEPVLGLTGFGLAALAINGMSLFKYVAFHRWGHVIFRKLRRGAEAGTCSLCQPPISYGRH